MKPTQNKKDCEECKSLPEGEVVKGHDHREKLHVFVSENHNNMETKQTNVNVHNMITQPGTYLFLDDVTRIEVINHTSKGEQGRAYTYWGKYGNGIENPKVSLQLQDDGRTLKVFIEELPFETVEQAIQFYKESKPNSLHDIINKV